MQRIEYRLRQKQDESETSNLHIKIFRRPVFLLLLAVLTLAILVDTIHIADKAFWMDESTTYMFSKKGPLDAIEPIRKYHMQPPLFYWISHFVIKLNDTPIVLRGISFTFTALTLCFIMLGIKEISLPARLLTCLIFIMSPHTLRFSTEFRPYTMAAFFIVVSSVLLARSVSHAGKWRPAILYGFSALGLQYSLTLNSWVFGCQMAALGMVMVLQYRKSGWIQMVRSMRPLILVGILLCLGYILFLWWLVLSGYKTHPPVHDNFFIPKAIQNSKDVLFFQALWPGWLWGMMGLTLFSVALFFGVRRRPGITAYLLIIFVGQILFSTYMTYSRISWFNSRYLTASVTAFALLCGLGFDLLFSRNPRSRVGWGLAVILLLISFPAATKTFYKEVCIPKWKSPYVTVVEDVGPLTPTIIYIFPWQRGEISYAFRNIPQFKIVELNPNNFSLDLTQRKSIFLFEPNAKLTGKPLNIILDLMNTVSRAKGYQHNIVDLEETYSFPEFIKGPFFPKKLHIIKPFQKG